MCLPRHLRYLAPYNKFDRICKQNVYIPLTVYQQCRHIDAIHCIQHDCKIELNSRKRGKRVRAGSVRMRTNAKVRNSEKKKQQPTNSKTITTILRFEFCCSCCCCCLDLFSLRFSISLSDTTPFNKIN